MTDSFYKVLGVKKDATDEQVRRAYIELKNKYDPASYEKEELKEIAAEKTKEISDAFDGIMNERRIARMQRGEAVSDGSSTKDSEQHENGVSGVNLDYVESLIISGDFDEAEKILNSVKDGFRTAKWNYLKGKVLLQKGWLEEAVNFFSIAVKKDPNNPRYREALNKAVWQRNGNFGYSGRNGQNGYGNPFNSQRQDCNICDMCTAMMCADMCCDCFGRGSTRYCC